MMGVVWTLGEPGEGIAPEREATGGARRERKLMGTRTKQRQEHERKQESTRESTQLRGSPKVIIPLLLHLLCLYHQI